jgi:hypothetical protein
VRARPGSEAGGAGSSGAERDMVRLCEATAVNRFCLLQPNTLRG